MRTCRQVWFHAIAITLALSLTRAGAHAASSPAITPQTYASLHWRLVGPFRGGRVLAVTGIPGNPSLFYFGAVDGGVWKTDDAGRTWNPIFDREAIGSIGAIAVAPSNPNIIYVGSGEADMRSDISYGNGIYRSMDGGARWKHIGLTDTRHIARVLIDPKNPQRVIVAALGHAYAANAERGIYRSLDGGSSWQRVLFVDNNTGAIDVAMDPNNSNHLIAAMWQTRRPPWNIYQPSNGPHSGLYATLDGGATWARVVGHGVPATGVGRMGIAFAPSDSRRAYLIADAKRGGLYRSDDGGKNWRLVNADARVWDRGWYFCAVTVDPNNSNTVYLADTALYRSLDAGKSFVAIKGSPDGDDFHALWIDPKDSHRMILGADQGASVSVNSGKTWSSWYNQPTGQFYHVSTDTRFPFSLYGAQQDSGAVAALSRSAYDSLTFRDWRAVTVGGESGMLAPDPENSDIVFGGTVERYDLRTSQDQIVDPTLPHPLTQWRETWTLPMVFSLADRRSLYFGRQVMFRSIDEGQSWKIISPDLARPDPGVPPNLDAVSAANSQGTVARRGVIYSIAPSPIRSEQIWAGTDDGKIWVTLDGGARWRDVTPQKLDSWSKVTMIAASWFDPNEAYAAIDRHRLDDQLPYIYRTRDGGATWQLIASGIPAGSYLNAVQADPERRGLLYAGTETGPFVSFDDGDRWLSLQLNLPNVSIRDFSIRGDSLAIATHGRGFWVLDDLIPLRQRSDDVAASSAWLFSPAVTVRVRPGDDQAERLPPDEPAAANPPTGALIDYRLAHAAESLELEIVDGSGSVVRQWSSARRVSQPQPIDFAYPQRYVPTIASPTASAGLHQFVWDLRRAPASGLPSRRRVPPLGPWIPPGHYVIRLSVDGRSFDRPLEIVKDPRVPASDADLSAQYQLAWTIEVARARGLSWYRGVRSALALLKPLERSPTSTCSRANVRIGMRQLDAIAGAPTPDNPDNSMGAPEINHASLHYLSGQLDQLEAAVESADTAPTPDERRAYAVINGLLDDAVRRLPRAVCGVKI